MTTRFPFTSWGLTYTEVFLHIRTIKAYMQSFQRGVEVDSTTKMSEEIAYSAQDRMNEEILQHTRISDKLAREELFEYLTGWIQYFEYSLNNTENLKNLINEYNDNRLIEYKAIIQATEEKFKQTKEYKTLNHLDFYKVENSSLRAMGLIQFAYIAQKRLEQYRKFCEAPDPDLIDISFLPQYIELITPIISRCVSIAKKRLSYLKGENELKQLPSSEAKTLKPIPKSIATDRLKVSVNAEQLAVLFRLLHDCDVISSNKKEIHAFVADHIQTVGMPNKRISPQNFGKLFSSKNTDIRNFWVGRLTLMIDKAGKKR